MYVPMLGLLWALVWSGAQLGAKPGLKALGIGGMLVALVAGSLLTRHQIPFWRDSGALFQRALDVTRDNHVMHYNYGRWLMSQHRFPEAEQEFREATLIFPAYSAAHNGLGWSLSMQEHHAESVASFEEALRTDPTNHRARLNLAQTLLRLGRRDEARGHLAILFESDPANAEVIQLLRESNRTTP